MHFGYVLPSCYTDKALIRYLLSSRQVGLGSQGSVVHASLSTREHSCPAGQVCPVQFGVGRRTHTERSPAVPQLFGELHCCFPQRAAENRDMSSET